MSELGAWLQWGGFGIIAVYFAWVLKAVLNDRKLDREERKERENDRVDEIKSFIEATNNFTMVVVNDLEHSRKRIEKMCQYIEENTKATIEMTAQLRANGRLN